MQLNPFWHERTRERTAKPKRTLSQGPRILLLSVDIGSGHYRAAHALRDAWHEAVPTATVRILNLMSDDRRFFSRVVKKTYMELINHYPHVYEFLYDLSKGKTSYSANSLLALPNMRALYAAIRRFNPDVVMATHPIPCAAAAFLKFMGKTDFLLVTVVTDFAVHPLWNVPGVDLFFVAADESRNQLLEMGIRASKIMISGIPVAAEFTAPEEKVPHQDTVPTVLVMGGGLGLGPMLDVVVTLEAIEQPLHVICLTGKNKLLARRMKRVSLVARHQVEIVPFSRDISIWMRRADLIITKPGGLTISEALSLTVPLVLFNPLPGQEAENAAFLCDRGAAIWPRTYTDLCSGVEALLFTATEKRQKMIRAEQELSRPQAARQVVSIVQAALAQRRQEK